MKPHYSFSGALALAAISLSSCAHAAPDAAVSTETTNPAPGPSGVRIPVNFTAPGKGFVSLALYDGDGVLVRSLLYAKRVEQGPQTVDWDGATDMGKPAAPGTYTAKGIFFTNGPTVKFVMEVGKSGNPPYRTPDGKGDWGGNLGAPASIVSNGKTILFAYGCVEDNQITGIQQMDGDGTISQRYFSFYPWDSRLAAAIDNNNYYLGIFNGQKHTTEIAAYTIGESRGKIITVLPAEAKPDQTETRWHGRLSGSMEGMAITADTLYATVASNDALYIVDRATGTLKNTVTIPFPHGVMVVGDHLLLVTNNKVVKLNLDGSPAGDFIPDGVLTAPNALGQDAEGRIYVGDSGAHGVAGPGSELGSRQVLVFSPAGQLISKIGKPGGSPEEGKFDANGFGMITSLCIGPGAGGKGEALWVNDIATGFPRTSRWSLDGHLEQQWFARKLSLFSDCFNPANPSELLVTSGPFADEPGISAYQMDIAHGTWSPSWHYNNTWADMYQEDVYESFEHGGNPYNGARMPQSRWPVFDYESRHYVTYQGRNYFMDESGNGDGAIFIYSAEHKPIPVALVCYHRVQKDGDKLESIYDQGPNNWFTWADTNGDGKMSPDEITYTADPPMLANTPRVNEAHLDDHMNVIMKRYVNDHGQVSMVDSILPLKAMLPNGAPVYDWGQLKDLVKLQPPDLTGGDGWKKIRDYAMPIPTVTQDGIYSMIDPEWDNRSLPPSAQKAADGDPLTGEGGKTAPQTTDLLLPGIDGQGWWASRNWRTKIAKFDPATGKCLWAVGRRAPGKVEPGQMYHPCYLAGVAGGAEFITDTLGPVWVWNKDGLYIGHLFHDFGAGIEDDQQLYGEIQATGVFTDPATGQIYSVANDTGAHVHQVFLPPITPVAGPKVILAAAQVNSVIPWDPDGNTPNDHPTYTALFASRKPDITGNFGDFWLGDNMPQVPRGQILLDGQHLANFEALYDNQNLYLHYDVTAPNGPINSGSELPYAPFVSGAYVDFSMGPNWNGPRKDVREGDMRLLMARIGNADHGDPFEQGYWEIKPGGTNPQTIASPAATVHFDQIMTAPGVQMALKVLGTDPKTGFVHYVLQASVPLADLGLTNPAGKSVGFDASVGVSDAEGDRRERAGHWAGLSEAIVVDRPGSSRLLPDTWGTMEFAPGT